MEDKSIWNVESLKAYTDTRFADNEKRYIERFDSQEKAIATAEHNRDMAITKAENAIEKKSDAVYVKFTGLQETLAEVMLRPEVESRFANTAKDIAELKKVQDQSTGKSTGYAQFIGWIIAAITIVGFIITQLK